MSRRSGNRHRKPEIDWERAAILHAGKIETEPEPKPEPVPEPEPEPIVVHNEFTRRIGGFSPEALEIMLKYGFEALDERGLVSVKFTGISRKPGKDIPYKTPALLESLDGEAVLSGVVDKKSVSEIGNGTYDIELLGEPNLDDHTSPRRLNVILGVMPEGFNPGILTTELAQSDLKLSAVDSINGTEVPPDMRPWELDGLWNRPTDSIW